MDETPTNTNDTPAPEAPAEAPAAPAPAPAPTPAPAPAPSGNKSHTGLIIGIIIAALLIIAGTVVCVILLTSNKDDGGDNPTPTGQEKPAEKPEEKSTSLITCVAEGDTWEYDNILTVDDKKLEVTKMKYVLKIDDDYDASELTDNEQALLAGAGLIIHSFDQLNDPGIKINKIKEADPETGAGLHITAELTRSKLEDEDLVSQFEEVDGSTAEELVEMIEANNLDDVKMFCEIE